MKRAKAEEYIDRVLDHANTLQALVDVDALAAAKITSLHSNRTRPARDETKSIFLLRKRIEIITPSYIADALTQQEYLLLPEFKRTDADRYRYLCSFNIHPSDLYRVAGYDLLVKVGYFNKDTNPGGVVKDHRLSINTAYTGKLNPDLVKHPANCEFLTVSDNARKGARDSLTIPDLLHLIEAWGTKKRRWRVF